MAAKKKASSTVKFPATLLAPVGEFLKHQLTELKRRREDIGGEDPFKNPDRVLDNASPDADAEEQFGHARTSAIRRELDRKIIQTRRALARVKVGKYGICTNCGNMIDTDRLMVYPEATLCVKCEAKRETR